MRWAEGTLENAQLNGGETHIWLVRSAVNVGPEQLQCLSDAERERAGRFRHANDAALFVTAHSLLRRLLVRYLNAPVAESSVRFRYSEAGRPYLDMVSDLDFNISHSGEYIVLGFIRCGRIGVDIEQIRPDIDWNAIRELLPEQVRAHIRGGDKHLEASYAAWTRYEAWAKATGQGIATNENVLWDDRSEWQQVGLPAVPGYALAAIVDPRPHTVRLFQWQQS